MDNQNLNQNILVFNKDSESEEILNLSVIERIVKDIQSLKFDGINDYQALGLDQAIEVVKGYNTSGAFLKID
jgi:hypothetical protein